MNYSKFLLATLLAFVALFIADYLWWMVIFRDWVMQKMSPSGSESVPFHALAELCMAGLFAIIYPMGYKGGSPASEGAKFGVLMGLVYALPGAIHHYAATGGSRAIPAFSIANGVVMGIIAGITIAMVYGRGAKAQA